MRAVYEAVALALLFLGLLLLAMTGRGVDWDGDPVALLLAGIGFAVLAGRGV